MASDPDAVVRIGGGCVRLLDDRRCVARTDRDVVIWTDAQDGPAWALLTEGRPLAVEPSLVDAGTIWQWRPELGSTVVVADRAGEPRWEVVFEEGGDAQIAAMREGAGLETCPAGPPADGVAAMRSFGCHRISGAPEARAALEELVGFHLAAGDPVLEGMARGVLASLGPAEGGTARLPPWEPATRSLDARFDWHHHHGMEAAHRGDLGRAERYLDEARVTGAALRGVAKTWRQSANHTTGQLSQLQSSLGRHREALLVHAPVVAELDPDPCHAGWHLEAFAWTLALAEDRGVDVAATLAPRYPAVPHDAWEALAQAEAAYGRADEEGGCPWLWEGNGAWNIGVMRGKLALARGEAADARAALEAARAMGMPSEWLHQAWFGLIDGRVALAEGDAARADRLFAEVRASSEEPHVIWWRAEVGRAQALTVLGEVDQARRLYGSSRALFGELAGRVPLFSGRGDFLAELYQAVQGEAALHLSQDDPGAAVAALRRYRRMHLFGLQQPTLLGGTGSRDGAEAAESAEAFAPEVRAELDALGARVGLGADAPLRPPAAGELMLLHTRVGERWLVFGLTTEGAQVRELPAGPEEGLGHAELSERLLAPVADWLARAERVTLLPLGPASGVPLHALPLASGAPLGAALPTVTSLDLDVADGAAPAVRDALVVSDPSDELPAAGAEGAAVHAALADRGVASRHLTGGQATVAAVESALGGEAGPPDLLHFAGHGTFGRDGWSARLVLADGGSLSSTELLSRSHAPETVVMTACESSRTTTDALAREGLAQVFLVSGSRWVVSADVPVPDELSGRYSSLLYAELADGVGVVESHRRVVRALAREAPGSPWWAFRVWSR